MGGWVGQREITCVISVIRKLLSRAFMDVVGLDLSLDAADGSNPHNIASDSDDEYSDLKRRSPDDEQECAEDELEEDVPLEFLPDYVPDEPTDGAPASSSAPAPDPHPPYMPEGDDAPAGGAPASSSSDPAPDFLSV